MGVVPDAPVRTGGRRDVRLLIGSALASNLGDGLRIASFALLAASFTDDARLVALVAAAASLPDLVLAIPVGVLVDRVRRLRMLWAVDVCRTLVYLVATVLVLTGSLEIWSLAVLAAVLGVCELAYDSGTGAVVPEVAGDVPLRRVNTAVRMAQEVGNGAVGPAVGSLLFGLSAAAPFAVAAGLFLLASLAIRAMPGYRAGATGEAARDVVAVGARAAWAGYLDDARQGLLFTLRSRPVRYLMLILFAWNFFGWMPEAVLVLYVTGSVGSTPAAYGLLLSVTAVGALIGGAANFAFPDRLRDEVVLIGALAVYGITLAVPGLVPNIWVAGVAFFVQGLPLVALSASTTTLRQSVVPDRMLGKVGSLIMLSSSAAATAGLALGGVVAERFTPATVFTWCGAAILVLAGYLWLRSSTLRRVFAESRP